MNEVPAGAQIQASVAKAKVDRETMRTLMDKGVEYCMPLYVDVHGIAKTKTVPIDHFDRMMRGSELFTGAALDGLAKARMTTSWPSFPIRMPSCSFPGVPT